MKKEIIDIICCPTCKGDLDLIIIEEKDDDIIKGIFNCMKCKVDYEIEDGIPNLLPKK